MKEEALALVRDISNPGKRLNLLREYLQTCVMRSLHESEAFLCLSFVGGTALRFLFNLPRFSEDLDFSIERHEGYAGVKWMEKIKRDLTLAGYEVSIRWNDRKTVHVAWVRVGRILHEAGLAALADQKLSIKLEMDTRPPAGAVCRTDLVHRHRIMTIQHHDLASLMAGKVHALLTRKYTKGRDWYDLIWYRSQRPAVEPNLVLLQNALDQTQGAGAVEASRWKPLVIERLHGLRWDRVVSDAAPFLEHPEEVEWLTLGRVEAAVRAEV